MIVRLKRYRIYGTLKNILQLWSVHAINADEDFRDPLKCVTLMNHSKICSFKQHIEVKPESSQTN